MSNPWAEATWDIDAQKAYIEAHGVERAYRVALRGGCYVRLPPVITNRSHIQQVVLGSDAPNLVVLRRALFLTLPKLGFTMQVTLTTQSGVVIPAIPEDFGFDMAALLTREQHLAAAQSIGFTMAAALVTRERQLGAAPAFGFAQAATLTTQRGMSAAAALGFSMSATLSRTSGMSAAAALGFSQASALTRQRNLTGAPAFGFSTSAALTRQRNLAASPALGFSQAATVSISTVAPDVNLGANLQSWHIAGVGQTLSGSTLTSWADQSGKGVTVTSLGSQPPTYAATGFNSLPTVQFDPTGGATGSFLGSGGTALTMGSNAHSLFAVVNLRSLGHANDAWLFAFLRGAGGGSFPWDNTASCVWMSLDRTTSKLKFTTNSADFAQATVSTSTRYRLAVINDGTNCTMYVNGAQVAQSARNTTLAATGQLQIGSEAGTGNIDATRGIFDLSELVTANIAASSTQLAKMDAYMKNKWNL